MLFKKKQDLDEILNSVWGQNTYEVNTQLRKMIFDQNYVLVRDKIDNRVLKQIRDDINNNVTPILHSLAVAVNFENKK